MPKYELICLKDKVFNINNLVKITLYVPVLKSKIELSKSLDINASDEEIYEAVKSYIYGKECSYVLLRRHDKKHNLELGTLLIGKSKKYILSPIPLRVKEVKVFSRSNPSESNSLIQEANSNEVEDESNIVVTNELWSLASAPINEEAYVYNADIEVLDDRVTALRLVTDEMDRIVVIEKEKRRQLRKTVAKSKRSKKRSRRKRRRRRLKKKR